MDVTSRADSSSQPITVAVAATFTAQGLERPLNFWLNELDLAAKIAFAPYNQPFQELLEPSSLLSTNQHGVNVLLIRLDDWWRAGARAEGASDLQQKASEFLAAVRAFAERLPVSLLVAFCPAAPAGDDSDRRRSLEEAEEQLAASLARIPSVDVVTSGELLAAYPVGAFYDPQGDRTAHLPYTPLFSTALATVVARWLYGLTQAGHKAIVVDCDNTLWTGICGEDGPYGVEIDAARRAVQEYLVGLHDKGVLVCLCSRNNEADVRAVFDARSADMPLRMEHVVSSRYNWKPKSENIRALAGDLGIAPDAFVFLDDDSVEVAEVQARAPEVLAIQLPPDTEAISGFLRSLWIFGGRKASDEAVTRTALYNQHAARARVRDETPSLADFLARLDLKIHFADLTPPRLTRASELTHRTNQFNVTSIRRSEAEIEAIRRQGADCVVVQVRDRFGDYGTVGLMIFSGVSETLAVDTFLLSCRALGRGVEHRMLKKLGEIAIERGLSRVELPLVASDRNQPALDFLNDVGAAFREPRERGFLFRIPADVAARSRYQPAERVAREPAVAEPSPERAATSRERAATLTSIARNLGDLAEIHAQVSARTDTRPNLENEYVAPRTPTEQTIAAILAEVLGIDPVGVEDNFFQLGGHSLLAMRVLFRIQEAFHVELSARLLYNSAFTAADLATKVLDLQLQAADPARVAALLDRLNELSDDEVRTLLAREMDVRRQPPQ